MHDLRNDQRGQATAEYALVLLAAAAVALALIVWATTSDVLPDFFTAVIRKVTSIANGTQLG
jgi:Flp pilus assembly pilin Flp